MVRCDYCDDDLSVSNPLVLYAAVDGDEDVIGQFCDYACLEEYAANRQQ